MKLWLNESRFIELKDNRQGETERIISEIAVRSRTMEWMGFYAYLPDPDLVLEKLGQTLSVYRNLLTDAHVWSCYGSRKSGTLSCEWEIREAAEGSVRSNRRVLEAVKEFMAKLDVYQIISDILEAPFFGMSPLEIVWKSAEQSIGPISPAGPIRWLPEKVEGKPPEWFVFSTENELRFLSRENMINGEELPDKKFLLARHHASYQNPYGERLLARCFWPVAFKKGGFKFWAIFTEKYGMPWVVGKVPRATNETERAALLTRLASMVQDAAAVINDDESIDIHESQGKTASSQVYSGLVEAGNAEVSKAILGQTLTTEIGGEGSYAASQTHMEVRQDLIDQDKRMVTSVFNELFRWFTELNFSGAAAPEFAFFEEEDIQKDRADRDKTLVDQGVRFTAEYYKRTYNLEETDFVVGEPRPQGPPGQFAENRAVDRFSQADVDKVSDQAAVASSEAIGALLAPIVKAIQGAKSMEEIGEVIDNLYPDIDPAMFQTLLARAMFTVSAGGAAAVKRER